MTTVQLPPVQTALDIARSNGGQAAIVPKAGLPAAGRRLDLSTWLMIGGLLVMYTPTLVRLLNHGLWSNDEHSHGPLILAICIWLIWDRWRAADAAGIAPDTRPERAWPLLAVGALSYVAGRALGIIYFELGSLIPMLAGVVLTSRGTDMLRALRFPLLYMVFMIPIPGFVADPISAVLKTAVSVSADNLLYLAGYPVARSGVILQIGEYRLLVADACAGMRTLFMLEALGILYLELVRHASWLRNVALALLIVPISFAANVGRVLILALLTYYFGDDVGQGFMHGFAGIALFLLGLAMMIGTDSLLRWSGALLGRRT
jgi:exosortase B